MAAKAEFECGAAAGDYPDFEFRVGQTHLVRDDDDCWYRASIQKVREPRGSRYGKLKFHYEGWSSDYDEWITLSPQNLAARTGRIRLWDESKTMDCAICLESEVASGMRVLAGCGHHLCFRCHQRMVEDESINKICHLCRAPYSRFDLSL